MQEPSLPCVWSCASSAWRIPPAETVTGYLWNWAENQVLVAMKSMPLGQSAGQRVLLDLGTRITQLAEAATVHAGPADGGPADAGPAVKGLLERRSNFAPGLAILSSQHESQYSRLFRS
jgi:urease accessory protein